jgi:hypothetical protein
MAQFMPKVPKVKLRKGEICPMGTKWLKSLHHNLILKIKTFPYYILLDEQLNIKSMPALAPSPNGLYETIEKTFYDITRKKENH